MTGYGISCGSTTGGSLVGDFASVAAGRDQRSSEEPAIERKVMKAEEIIERATDTLTVRRVYGEPFQENGVTLILPP